MGDPVEQPLYPVLSVLCPFLDQLITKRTLSGISVSYCYGANIFFKLSLRILASYIYEEKASVEKMLGALRFIYVG